MRTTLAKRVDKQSISQLNKTYTDNNDNVSILVALNINSMIFDIAVFYLSALTLALSKDFLCSAKAGGVFKALKIEQF